jgi:NTP pyrophosphatase (non-canonical NTP hydrolase)
MEFKSLQNRALQIRQKYAELEKAKGSKEWTREDLVRGFVGDVGDLVKLTMAADGVREIPNASERLSHELADCLWSVLVIADKYGVDIESSFLKTMNELEARIGQEMQK